MDLIKFNDLPDTSTPLNAENLNHNFNELKNNIAEEYSMKEIKTNKVWIDGKPIYRKVYSFTLNNQYPSDNNIGLAPDNFNQIIKLHGVINTDTNQVAIPTSWNNIFDCGVMIQDSNIVIRNTWDILAGKSGYVIVEYTKTTE